MVEAVIDDLARGRADGLDHAGRAWARAHRSVSAMVGRLASLREAAATEVKGDDQLRLHRAIDRVTTTATEEVLNRLEEATRTDALTGVGNRRAFDETLSATLSAAHRRGHDVTVVAVDLDGLKRINDTEGHAAGDAALMALVRALYADLRDEDRVFRVGGDEFVILLPFTSVDAAERLMERIQRAGAPAFTWGAAGYPVSGADARRLVDAADQDLYRRRQDRRAAVGLVPLKRPVSGPVRRDLRRAGRWAWVPAAAVVLASLIATLVASGAAHRLVAVGHPRQHPVTKPSKGSSSPAGQSTGPTSTGTSPSGTVVTVGYATSPSPAIGAPSGQSSPGTSPTPSPGSPTSPTSPSTGQGGVLGELEQVLAPVPLVGGDNGLLAVVGELLTGPSPSIVSTSSTGSTGSTGSTSSTGSATSAVNGGSTSSSAGSGLLLALIG